MSDWLKYFGSQVSVEKYLIKLHNQIIWRLSSSRKYYDLRSLNSSLKFHGNRSSRARKQVCLASTKHKHFCSVCPYKPPAPGNKYSISEKVHDLFIAPSLAKANKLSRLCFFILFVLLAKELNSRINSASKAAEWRSVLKIKQFVLGAKNIGQRTGNNFSSHYF